MFFLNNNNNNNNNLCDSAVFCALHDQLASLGRHAQLTRCFSAIAELLVSLELQGSYRRYGSYQEYIVNKNMATKDVDSGFSVDFCRVLEAYGCKWIFYRRIKKSDSSVIVLSNGVDVWRHDIITPASTSSFTDFTNLRFGFVPYLDLDSSRQSPTGYHGDENAVLL